MAVENSRLFERSRMRERWLATNAEINEQMLNGASAEDTLRLVAERARELSEADWVLLLRMDEGQLTVTATSGAGSAELLGARIVAERDELFVSQERARKVLVDELGAAAKQIAETLQASRRASTCVTPFNICSNRETSVARCFPPARVRW